MMKRFSTMLLLALSMFACAGSEDAPSPAPPTPAPAPAPSVVAAIDASAAPPQAASTPDVIASISSVTLAEDCLKTKANKSRSAGMTKVKAKRAPGSKPFGKPCSQSMLQIAFSGESSEAVSVSLRAIRLKSSSGDVVATLTAREPSMWVDTSYQPWDGMLPAGKESKSSYKISVPNWREVETAIGGGSYGHMFTVEVDVTIGSSTTTITSPQVERKQRAMIKT